MTVWATTANVMCIAITIFIVGLELLILWKIATGAIPLKGLICEPGDGEGKASLSRFQFLLFTFVVAGVFLLLSIESGTFVQIPENVLWLIGISGGSYTVSKGLKTWGETTESVENAKRSTADAAALEAAAVAAAAAARTGRRG